ncbi:MAG: Bax inhibitor-1 family protein, partial [Lachnospiraceae bacterium]|nr:Bax inhibitor-1 family protein [Lachnospiraceae bacterium]
SLLVCIVVDLIALILGQDLVIVDYAVTFIFTLFVGYDWARANACAKTLDNAVDCAAELYLDIINLFLRILSILGRDN